MEKLCIAGSVFWVPFAWSDNLIDNLDNLKKYSNWTFYFIFYFLSTGIIMSSLANIIGPG